MNIYIYTTIIISILFSNGYTTNSTCETGYIECSVRDCCPETFYYEQSTQQAFYYIYNVTIDGLPIADDDWVGVFNGDICTGSNKWNTSICNGGVCDVPAMGFTSDLSNYFTDGDIPSFKIFKAATGNYYDANEIILASNPGNCTDLNWNLNKFCILESINATSGTNSINNQPLLPTVIELTNIYPNPFNPVTSIDYNISENGYVSIFIYNINGEQVAQLLDSYEIAGTKTIKWDATNFSSGIYFVKLISDNFSQTNKILLIK